MEIRGFAVIQGYEIKIQKLLDLYNFLLRGPGGGGVDDPGKVEIEFTVVPDRGECQLPDTFYQIKKYCS